MKKCMCCLQYNDESNLTFYCLSCYNELQQKYNLSIDDYIAYFQTTYNIEIYIKQNYFYCLNSFDAIHDVLQHKLKFTDKSLDELLEIILFLKVTGHNYSVTI